MFDYNFSFSSKHKPFFPKTPSYEIGWKFVCTMAGAFPGILSIPFGAVTGFITTIPGGFILMVLCWAIPAVIYLTYWNIRNIPWNIKLYFWKKERAKAEVIAQAKRTWTNTVNESMQFIKTIRYENELKRSSERN